MTPRENAISTLVRLGVDVLAPIDADGCVLDRSDAYIVAYAQARADAFSEDNVQRDEKGKFSSGGGGGKQTPDQEHNVMKATQGGLTVPIPDSESHQGFKSEIAAHFGPGAVVTQNEDESISVEYGGAHYTAEVGSNDEDLVFHKSDEPGPSFMGGEHLHPDDPLNKSPSSYDDMSGKAILESPEYKSLTPSQQGSINSLMEKDQPINESMSGFLNANVENNKPTGVYGSYLNGISEATSHSELEGLHSSVASSPTLTPSQKATALGNIEIQKQHLASNPLDKLKGPSAEASAHAKAARDAAKAIVEHTKKLRSEYKKNPTAENKAKLEAAEKTGKAARSAARKAEAAKTPAEAQKHAEKASSHLAKLVGGDEEAKAYAPVSKPAAGKPAPDKPIDKAANHELHKAADKLLTEAEKPHPSTWTPEKVAAKEAAVKSLTDHAGAKTPAELKAAADAFDAVAKKASAAGSYWGHAYTSLAEKYREAAQPKESFDIPTGSSSDSHDVAPSHSARPIASIKGEDVSAKTQAEHREKYTKTLTDKEKSAALSYSGNSFTTINSHLRSGGEPTAQNRQLDKAIAKSPAPRDMVVHRGLSGPFSEKMFAGMKPGDQYVEKAYSSTSAGDHAAFGGGVLLHITVPKGYPAAPIPSHHEHEREYLLRRNTKFEVTKVEKVGSKVVAHVTVVHDQPPE